jgi:hypothetical protein
LSETNKIKLIIRQEGLLAGRNSLKVQYIVFY